MNSQAGGSVPQPMHDVGHTGMASAYRYPVEMIDMVELRNGQRVMLRPVLPQDAPVLQAFVRNLSAASRNYRFMHGLGELPPRLLQQMIHIDQRSHVALVAEIFPDGVETIIGEARYVVVNDGGSAEFAVAVADRWQGLGLAKELLRRLCARAEAAGVGRFIGEARASNAAIIHLARKAGFSTKSDPNSATIIRFEKMICAKEPRRVGRQT